MDIGQASTEALCFWSDMFTEKVARSPLMRDNLSLQLPGMIITLYATHTPIPEEWKVEIARYLANVQRRGGADDQGWGL